MMKVLAGDWKADQYIVFKKTIFGKKTHLMMPKGVFSSDKIPLSEIKSVQVVNEDNSQSIIGSVALGAVGAIAFGGIGLVAGALAGANKGSRVVCLEFKDGRRALMTCGTSDLETLMAATF